MNICYPVLTKFAITSPYSKRSAIKTSEGYSSTDHKGIDLDVLQDTDHDYIVSCTDGVVQTVAESRMRGKYVYISNNDGGGCLYQHLKSISVKKGQSVSCKSIIGIMGDTGNVSGKHLHFGVSTDSTFEKACSNNTWFNPAIFWGIDNYNNLKGKIFDGSGTITGTSAAKISTNSDADVSNSSSSTISIKQSNQIDIVPSGEFYEIKDLKGVTSDWLYGRRYRVIVDVGGGKAFDVSELRCTFEISKSISALGEQSTVSIYNLSPDDENKLIKAGQRIILEAGYNGDQYGKIFEGNIIQPIRSKENGTDYKLTLVSMDSDRFVAYGLIGVSLTAQETARNAIKACISRAGELTGNNFGMQEGTITEPNINYPRGKVMFGAPTQYLNQIAKSMNASYYNEDGTVNIISPKELADNQIFDLSPDTGLIGTPTQNENGITCSCLLNPRMRINSLFRIDNSRVSNMKYSMGQAIRPLDSSGIYRVIKITHLGDSRGDTWETKVDAISQAGILPGMMANENMYIY